MRHIELNKVLQEIFSDEAGQKTKRRLERAHQKAEKQPAKTRKTYIDKNGRGKWKPIKDRLTSKLTEKCWYTETGLTGADSTIDHYRPVCHYWWLAFEPKNYRVASPWANSPKHNALYGCAGGKGEQFPLLPPGSRATCKEDLENEQPVILDPCKAEDCKLLAFQADGRPILHPAFKNDSIAKERVEQSNILLNLDHPAFNAKREQLCQKIEEDIRIHEALPIDAPERLIIRRRIEERLTLEAPFSTAARFYLQLHRHLDWVEAILTSC